MSRSRTHLEFDDMLGLYALGALEVNDAAGLEAHLAACELCRTELADLRGTVAELARAPQPVEPSAEVTRRILRAAPGGLGHHPSAVRSPARQGAGRRRRLRSLWAGGALAAVLVVGLVVSQIVLVGRLDRTSAVLARGRDLLEFMASPNVVTLRLGATDRLSTARALVAYDRRSSRVVFLAFDLPPLPTGRVYQLWAIADRIRPAAVLSTGARGDGVLHQEQADQPREVPLFAVTLEPAPGTDEPTGDLLLLGGLPRDRPRQAGSR